MPKGGEAENRSTRDKGPRMAFLLNFAIGLAVMSCPFNPARAVSSFPYLINPTNPTPARMLVNLGWNPSPSPDAAGYFVCWGYASGMATNCLDAGNVTNATVAGLSANSTYYFTVVVYNTSGEQSPPSNELQFVPTASATNSAPQLAFRAQGSLTMAPPVLTFQGSAGTSYVVQATQDFINWTDVWTTNCLADGRVSWMPPDISSFPCRFYRLVRQ